MAILQMGLKETEPIKGERSGLFRKFRQVLHIRRVRQIAGKFLRLIFCKVIGDLMLDDMEKNSMIKDVIILYYSVGDSYHFVKYLA